VNSYVGSDQMTDEDRLCLTLIGVNVARMLSRSTSADEMILMIANPMDEAGGFKVHITRVSGSEVQAMCELTRRANGKGIDS